MPPQPPKLPLCSLLLLFVLANAGFLFGQANINESLITQTRTVKPGGGGDFTTLTAAFTWLANNPTVKVKILIDPGTYREGTLTLNNRDTLTILEGTAPGSVIISGSDLWTSWTSDGAGNWYKSWTTKWGERAPIQTESGAGLRGELVFVNGVLLRQVTTLAEMAPGTFHVDETTERITIRPQFGLDPNTQQVEVSMRRNLLTVNRGTNLVLRNLVFQHAANNNQHPFPHTYAVFIGGEHNDADPNRDFLQQVLIENCVARWNNSSGMTIANTKYMTVRNTLIQSNGNAGIGSNRMQHVLWQNNTFVGNNWRVGLIGGLYGDNPAGTKLLSHNDATIENCDFVGNYAAGLWLDYGSENITVRRSRMLHNMGEGFYNEANYGPITADGILVRQNANFPDEDISTGGVLFAEANAFTLVNSYLIDNAYYGLGVRSRDRLSTAYWSNTPYDGPCRNMTFSNNLVVASRNTTKLYQTTETRRNGNAIANHVHAQQSQFISDFVPTYIAANNRYYSPHTTAIFSSPTNSSDLGYVEVDLAAWKAATGQDTGSVWDAAYASRIEWDSFTEAGGQLVFEAENYHTYNQRTDTARWLVGTGYLASEIIGASGWGYMQTPNAGAANGTAGAGAILTYKINIVTPGTYHLALRRLAATSGDDSAIILVNGTQVGDASIVSGTASTWQWKRAATSLGSLTAGIHTVSIVRCEDGFLIDRVMIANDTAKLPTDGSIAVGAAESELGEPPVAGNPITLTAINPSTDERAQQTLAFRVSRYGTSGNLTVNYSVSGSATAGVDYTAPSGSAIIPSGSSFVDILVPVIDDPTPEREETISLTLLGSVDYDISVGLATTTILASDLVTPSTFDVVQLPSTTSEVQVQLRNPLATALTYSIGSGNNGSDYTFLKNGQPGGPTYSWTEISTTGTLISALSNKSDAVATVPVGFSFPFYNGSFSSVRVCTNGFLSFTDSVTNSSFTTLPSTYAPANLIAPMWRPMPTDSSSNIYYKLQDPDTFIVQWQNIRWGKPTQRITFQVVLKSDGRIFFYYKGGAGSAYTIGIQNGSKNSGTQVSYNTNYVSTNTAIAFSRVTTWLSNLGPLQITVPAGGTATTNYTVNTTGYALGFTETIPVAVTHNHSLGETNTLQFNLTVGQPVLGDPTNTFFEAEDYVSITSPMEVQADLNASGGYYIRPIPGTATQTSPPASGITTYSFTTTRSGNHQIWGRVIAPNTSADSLYVRVNNGNWINWNTIPGGSSWHWAAVHDSANANQVVNFNLAEGTHTLQIATREDATRLDRLYVTSDLGLTPSDVALRESQLSPPAAPSSLALVALSSDFAQLSWADNSNDESGFVLKRANDPAGPFQVVATLVANTSSHTDTGLSPGTTYYYKVQAFNTSGSSTYSNTLELTTTSDQFFSFDTVGDLATHFSRNGADHWQETAGAGIGGSRALVPPDGKTIPSSAWTTGVTAAQSREISLKFQWRTSAVAGGSPLYLGLGPTSSYIPSLALTAGDSTNYHLYVCINKSNDAALINRPRIKLNSLYAGGSHNAESAYISTDLVDGRWYELKMAVTFNGNSAYSLVGSLSDYGTTGTALVGVVANTSLNTTNALLAANPSAHVFFGGQNAYRRGIAAVDNLFVGNVALGAPPVAPADPVATTQSNSAILVTWTHAGNATGFRVERSLLAEGPFEIVGILGSGVTQFLDQGLNEFSTYYYRVIASNTAGDSTPSAVASATTLLSLPGAPSALAATAQDTSSILLTWSDNSTNEASFKLERATAAGGPFTEIALVGTDITEYLDTGLPPDATRYYRLRASNAAGESDYTSVATATTEALAPRVIYAYEGFQNADYPTVNNTLPSYLPAPSLTGFTGNWSGSDFRIRASAYNSVPTLSYTDGTRTLASGGTIKVGESGRTGRLFDVSAGGSFGQAALLNGSTIGADTKTLYIAFVMRVFAPGYSALELHNGGSADTNRRIYVGCSYATNATNFLLGTRSNSGTQTTTPLGALSTSAPQLFVVKIEFGAGTTSGNEKITVWQNPQDLTAEGLNTPIAVLTDVGNFTFDRMHLAGFSSGQSYFDEIRLGDHWTAVAPLSESGAPPASPSNPSAIAQGTAAIQLAWTDNSANELGFKIERSADGVSNWTTLIITQPGVTTYTDTGLNEGTTYHYRIRAAGSVGDSSATAVVSATTDSSFTPLELWVIANALPADLSLDTDSDGVSNLLEYALAGDPLLEDESVLPQVGEGAGHLELTFERISDPSLTYQVWASTDLVDWGTQPIWTSSGAQNTNGSVTVQDPELTNNFTRRFLRLKVLVE